jgi:hypothetical protein
MTRLARLWDWALTVALLGAYVGALIYLPSNWYPLKIMMAFPVVLGASIATYEAVRDRWPTWKVAGWLFAFLLFWCGVFAIVAFLVPRGAATARYADDYCPGPPIATC